MNKAFVKESDDNADDDLEIEAPSLPAGARNYMTRQGYERLQAELNNILKIERPETVRVVSWAASNGDRSENGDYIYGKKKLRELDRRIRYLTKRLESADVIDTHLQENQEQVFFGATVEYIDQDDREHKVTIVGVDEADPLQGRISWVSPVARALTKARLGDVVTFNAPDGQQELEIVAISYPSK